MSWESNREEFENGTWGKPGMKERPILFKGEMVRAILEGTKTQTRRVIKPQPSGTLPGYWKACKYGEPGDRLWVRETYALESNFNIDCEYNPPHKDGRPINWEDDPEWGKWWEQPHYRATDPKPDLCYEDQVEEGPHCRWTPSIFMPRWASRIILEITEVKVRRVQETTDSEALAEGVTGSANKVLTPLDNFELLWDSINGGKLGRGWKDNPWVWVIEFKLVTE